MTGKISALYQCINRALSSIIENGNHYSHIMIFNATNRYTYGYLYKLVAYVWPSWGKIIKNITKLRQINFIFNIFINIDDYGFLSF